MYVNTDNQLNIEDIKSRPESSFYAEAGMPGPNYEEPQSVSYKQDLFGSHRQI